MVWHRKLLEEAAPNLIGRLLILWGQTLKCEYKPTAPMNCVAQLYHGTAMADRISLGIVPRMGPARRRDKETTIPWSRQQCHGPEESYLAVTLMVTSTLPLTALE